MKLSFLEDAWEDYLYWSHVYPFPMIFPVFGSRPEAIFSSPISPSREPTLGVETGSKIPPHLGPKIPSKSSGMGIDKAILKKINQLIKECMREPFCGIGKPEPLKFSMSGCWSRRITDEHRLVYRVEDDALIIIQCRYHY